MKAAQYKLNELLLYFLKLGTIGFGGPVALVGYMHRDLVEKNKWISNDDYKEGLTFAQLAPGPLAAQLAMYIGYIDYGTIGATLCGIVFILPSFLMVVILGTIYIRYGVSAVIQNIFYGIGACVIGIIAVSAQRLTVRTLKKEWLLWIIFVISGVLTVVTERENVFFFIGSGIAYWLIKKIPVFKKDTLLSSTSVLLFLLTLLLFSETFSNTPLELFLFFAKAGSFVFGSGLAIVPFLYSGVVKEHHWLNDRQFLDAVAVAMITPGPVVITSGFIGYLVDDLPGALVAAAGTFFPCYFLTVVFARYFKKYGKKPGIKAFVEGVTSAAIGAISGAVIVLARKSIVDVPSALIVLATLIVLIFFKRIPEQILVLSAGILGMILKFYII